jgi:hypothetical protein
LLSLIRKKKSREYAKRDKQNWMDESAALIFGLAGGLLFLLLVRNHVQYNADVREGQLQRLRDRSIGVHSGGYGAPRTAPQQHAAAPSLRRDAALGKYSATRRLGYKRHHGDNLPHALSVLSRSTHAFYNAKEHKAIIVAPGDPWYEDFRRDPAGEWEKIQ